LKNILQFNILILLLVSSSLLSFPKNQQNNNNSSFELLKIKVKVVNGTDNLAIDAPLYASLSAITDNFIISSFKTEKETSPLIFNDVKIYPSAKFYELALSYKGVNYFKKFTKEEIKTLNNTEFKVYEQGNLKKNIELERLDYIIEVDERNKVLKVTEDILIDNTGNFTYSPILPQDDAGIKIPVPVNTTRIIPAFNISENNYSLMNDHVLLKVFLRPGKNYFTFSYFIKVDEFPYVLRVKTKNKARETRVIIPDARNKLVSNLISNFSIRETEQGTVKIGIKKNILLNKDLTFKIIGKPSFKKGFISSTRNSFFTVKKVESIVGYGGLGILIIGVIYMLIFIKPKDEINTDVKS